MASVPLSYRQEEILTHPHIYIMGIVMVVSQGNLARLKHEVVSIHMVGVIESTFPLSELLVDLPGLHCMSPIPV